MCLILLGFCFFCFVFLFLKTSNLIIISFSFLAILLKRATDNNCFFFLTFFTLQKIKLENKYSNDDVKIGFQKLIC